MSEVKDDLKREKVRIVEISKIKDFPDHPFLVKEDESMDQLVNSIRMNGVLNHVIARRVADEHYELISGHRRKRACILLGIDRMPLIGREMTREEAVIEMVDSNLQREHILPSKKAKAYKMKMEAMSKDGGLDINVIRDIMLEEKPNQKPRIKIAVEKIEKYFPSGTTKQQMEDIIIRALAMYRQRQKEDRDAR